MQEPQSDVVSNQNSNEAVSQLGQVSQMLIKELRRYRRRTFWSRIFWIVLILSTVLYFVGRSSMSISTPHVAIIDIKAPIAEGTTASTGYVLPALKQAFESPQVEAVILDINSPGGSAVHSNRIFEAIINHKIAYPDKKVYAVCSDVCASGAYYIAAAADEILADGASIVGSIGVIMAGFGFDQLIKNYDIEWRLQTAGENKAMLDSFSPKNPKHIAMLQTMLDSIHAQFIDAVKTGRGDKLSDNPELFSGRFWSGSQSVELGLIDRLGSIEKIIESLDLPSADYSVEQPWFNQIMGVTVGGVQQLISGKSSLGQSVEARMP